MGLGARKIDSGGIAGVEEAIEAAARELSICPRTRQTSTQLSCLSANSKPFCGSLPSRPFLLYAGASVLSYRPFLL